MTTTVAPIFHFSCKCSASIAASCVNARIHLGQTDRISPFNDQQEIRSSFGAMRGQFAVKRGVLLLLGEGGDFLIRGCTVRAVCEMPRPCAEETAQAQRFLPVSKSNITKSCPKTAYLC